MHNKLSQYTNDEHLNHFYKACLSLLDKLILNSGKYI